ncbi:MAG TPA: cyclodeaminase/cyclohydrolase family protein [Thermoanaerobaculia bacterium]
MTDFGKLPLDGFLSAVASEAPTPGGGTAAAVAGALGAALTEMVAALTLSKEKFASAHTAMRSISEAARRAREEFSRLAREDSTAYDSVVAARRLPKETEDQKASRQEAIQNANRKATEVPMRTARLAATLLSALPELVEKGNPNALSDAGSAAILLEGAVESALLNVGINLPGVSDLVFVGQMQKETAALQVDSQRLRSQIVAAVRKTF